MSDQQRQLRDPGRYIGDLAEAVYGFSKGGTPQMTLRFDIQQGGGTAYVFKYFTDKSFEFSAKDLQALGFNGDFNAPKFSKATGVELTCKHGEDQNGVAREEWNIGGTWMPEKAPVSAAGEMNAKYRGLFGAQPTRKPEPAKTAATPPPPDDANNDTFEREDGVEHTKATAWAAWVEAQNPPDPKRWKAVIAEVGKGKAHADMTGSDWAAVANKAIPI